MKMRDWRVLLGVAAGGFGMLCAPVAFAQTQVGTPPPKDQVRELPLLQYTPQPGQTVDPATGAIREWGPIVAPVHIPYDGVFPAGTMVQEEREAGRPMRPFGEIYLPGPNDRQAEGWPDQGGDITSAQPLMQDFEAIGPNGLTPPDPDLARGYEYEVCVTNDDFAVYDSCGNEVYYNDINDYLGISDFCFDPKVIFDPWGGRWVMMYHTRDSSPQESSLLIIVTGNSTPFGVPGSDVWYYRFNMVQDSGTNDASWMDYADLGYSNTQLFASGNMFRFSGGFRWARILVFDKAAIYARGGAGWLWWHGLQNQDGSTADTPRSVKMQASWSENGNIDAYYVNSKSGGGTRINFWKVRGAFGSNTLTRNDVGVAAFTPPPDAVQPTGESIDTIDCRLMTAVATTDTLGNNGIELFTGLTTARGSDAACRLYKFDAVSTAVELDRDFFADNWDYWFPCSAADYSGSNFWVFCRTQNASGGEPEVRFVDMDQGTFSNSSSQIRDGSGSYNGFRWGDYQGGQLDWGDYSANFNTPGRPAKVWLYGEFGKNDSWGTHVGATSVYPQGSISSVTPSTTWVISGPPGGPFSPSSQVYTLSSAAGDVGTAFEVLSLPSWLDASREYGQIWTSNTSTLSVNSAANNLGLGTYTDTVVFDDCFNGQGSFNRTVELRVQAPDLEVVSIDAVNGTYNPGDSLNVSGSYRNNGNLAIRSYTADFYLSDNTLITPADILLGTQNYGTLNPGSTENFSHNFNLRCYPEDDYYVGVIVTVIGDADDSDNVNLDRAPISYELCAGDYNGDCSVNTIDVISFLNDWSAGDRAADCNNDGRIDTQDVICFLNLWNGPC